MSKVMLHYY